MPEDQVVTWVGALSGGLPVAALALLISWLVWRAWERDRLAWRSREEALVERLIARDDVLVPLFKDQADALARVAALLERQATSNQAGGR